MRAIHSFVGLTPSLCQTLLCWPFVQNNELVEMLQSRVRELEADTEAGKQELMAAVSRLQEQEEALK
jgi:hypothetical protein